MDVLFYVLALVATSAFVGYDIHRYLIYDKAIYLILAIFMATLLLTIIIFHALAQFDPILIISEASYI
jgi:hypothetical protein